MVSPTTDTSKDPGSDKRKSGRSEPLRKQLPTDRIRVEKQFEIIRAFAAASGGDRRPVSNKQAATIVGLSDATLSLGNPFLVDTGIVEKTDAGFVPSQEAVDFKRATELGEERPEARLAPLLRKTWFFEILRPKLEFQALPESTALTDIGVQVGAGKSDLSRVRALIDYLHIAGVVQRDSGMLTLPRADPVRKVDEIKSDQPKNNSNSHTDRQPNGLGAITFNVNVNVSMEDLLGWDAQRIAAFMDGVKGILRAQKGAIDAE